MDSESFSDEKKLSGGEDSQEIIASDEFIAVETKSIENITVVTEKEHLENIYQEIKSKPNVTDVIISHRAGDYIKTNIESEEKTLQYTGSINQLIDKTRVFMSRIFPNENIDFLRIRTIKNEIIVTFDPKYDIIVIQNAPKFQKR